MSDDALMVLRKLYIDSCQQFDSFQDSQHFHIVRSLLPELHVVTAMRLIRTTAF